MPALPLSMAISNYDHVSDVVSGRVRPEGIELNAMELPIEEVFFRMYNFLEWDIAEFSMAKYCSMTAAGTAPFGALPVFPSRVFRQSAIYVAKSANITDARDLAGKRIGVPEWAQTAGVYARGFLQHQFGLQLRDVHWFQSGVNQAGRHEKVALSLPEGVSITAVEDRSLNQMLLDGDLDAIMSARDPIAFTAHDPRILRLWPNYQAVEEKYFAETGVFPIMHAVVVRNSTLERHPWVAMNLFRAFEEAKNNSLVRLASIVNSRIAIPWSHVAYERAETVLGKDFWPYGIEANRRTLKTFLQFCREQGITQRDMAVEELFPQEVSRFVRV